MGDYENLYKDVSNQNVDTAELERRKKERYQNRFNYYNIVPVFFNCFDGSCLFFTRSVCFPAA